ncbi:septum formation initiator family protein [bacterium]|jgi:cell division protein FtsB|nr:septum formation initiator family protein [bacterium]MBT4649049.1 septum formation initiator family protein [bacterium]
MRKKKKSFWGSAYNSNIFIVILTVTLVLSVLKVGKELSRRQQINREISNLNEQLSAAKLQRDKLDDLIVYLQTDEYVEEQARWQLNLSKPGEKRIDLSSSPKPLNEDNQIKDKHSNMQKWFNYFFQ